MWASSLHNEFLKDVLIKYSWVIQGELEKLTFSVMSKGTFKMIVYSILPLDEENMFGKDKTIVSKIDTKGRARYANDILCRVAEMTTKDLIGQPHSIIRRPDMLQSLREEDNATA